MVAQAMSKVFRPVAMRLSRLPDRDRFVSTERAFANQRTSTATDDFVLIGAGHRTYADFLQGHRDSET